MTKKQGKNSCSDATRSTRVVGPKCGTLYVGIDASLTATALAMIHRTQLAVASDRPITLLASHVIETFSKSTLAERLRLLDRDISELVRRARLGTVAKSFRDPDGSHPTPQLCFAMEGFSFGDRFQRETLGAVQGVIRVAVLREFECEIELVTPRAVKLIACPTWHGWTKKHWIESGRSGKFKMSMPTKDAVGAGLFKHYGINARNEHEADAACVAIAALQARELGKNG